MREFEYRACDYCGAREGRGWIWRDASGRFTCMPCSRRKE